MVVIILVWVKPTSRMTENCFNHHEKQWAIFFDFLRFIVGSSKEIPDSLNEADWKEIYAIAKKQCLVGVLFDGIKKLPAEHLEMKKKLLK